MKNQSLMIATFFTLLILITPLYYSSGYFILAALLFCILLSHNTLHVKDLLILLFTGCSFIIYFVLMLPQLATNVGFRNCNIVMFFTAVTLVLFKKRDVIIYNKGIYVLDIFYFIFFSYILIILCKYEFTCLKYNLRYIYGYIFPYGLHYVDFSVLVMLCLIFGIRRSHFISCILLAVISLIILPSRSLYLFIYSFAFLISLFSIKELRKMIILLFPKRITCLCIILILLTVLFSYCFVTILPKFFQIAKAHQSLFDDSNFNRFKANLYGIQIIIHEKLFFKSIMPGNNDYINIYNSPFALQLHPHNSFLSIILYNSFFWGVSYLTCISKWAQKKYCINYKRIDTALLLSYVITSLVLHDMFIGQRFFCFFIFLQIPRKIINFKFFHVKYDF